MSNKTAMEHGMIVVSEFILIFVVFLVSVMAREMPQG